MKFDIFFEDAAEICNKVSLSKLKDKTVIVTGASGVLGSYFVACLRHLQKTEPSNLRVYALTYSTPLSYLKELCDFEGAHILQLDLTDPLAVAQLPNADLIIHAAGYGQPQKFLEDQARTIYLNTAATFSLFQKMNPTGQFLFISTSEVYSGLEVNAYREEHIGTTNTDHPRACYIEAKRSGEAICYAYKQKGIDVKIARVALAYGPGVKLGDKRALHSFVEKGIKGKIELLDEGLAKRTYCYVTDAMEIFWNILFHGTHTLYNVGGASRTTIRELAKKIGKMTSAEVIFPAKNRELKSAPPDVFLDISRATKEFGKRDFVSLEKGLEKTIAWQRSLLENTGEFSARSLTEKTSVPKEVSSS
ncbi:MAG: NAD-dependent epimerase/dehydratase family protein [Deltaproteobacteria bacterium]|nr:NAD-dependent epimerase/dehydratase family protein [Deltaproteobacteria bacterium]